MAKYLVRASYTTDGVSGLMDDGGSSRQEAAEELVASLGGSIEAFYFSFGEHDVVIICDMPDNAAVVAATGTVAASGAMTVADTTVLITPEEVDEASKLTGRYRPPSS
jgi:uncharacterized protein with GYD domain